jgi:hypothetical protein
METILEMHDQLNEIDSEIQELKDKKYSVVEKEWRYLKTRINILLTKFNKEYDSGIKKVIVMGKIELSLLYEAFEFLSIGHALNVELTDSGLISEIWDMEIYSCNTISFLKIFGKADNILFVEERYNK